MIERILDLMKKNGVKANKLTSELGMGMSSITDWKNGKAKPSFDAIIKIADYFGVSSDYLLGRTDDPSPISETKKSAAEKLGDAVIGALVKAGKIEADEPLTPELVDSVVRVVYTFASLET